MLPLPPHCAVSRRPGSQRVVQPREQGVMVLDPVKHGVREGGVHRLGQLELRQVHGIQHVHPRSPAKRSRGLVHHRRRRVGRHHVGPRDAIEQQL